ncbi:MAG: type II secretion system F family protein [Gammaproteobacteria bacterium]
MPIELQDVVESSGTHKARLETPKWLQPGVSASDRIFFTEQLALMLETGVSLHNALAALAEQTQSTALRQLLEAVAASVASGRTFSAALADHPDVFDSSYVNLVGAAEKGGFLYEVLEQLRELEDKREAMRNTLTSAAAYPAFLLVFSIAVVLFILWVVFPKFGQMFTSIYDQLPGTTKTLMWMSDTLRYRWPLILGGVSAAGLLLRAWASSDAGRALLDRWRLRLPGLKQIFVPIYLIQILRTMGLSLNHGVPLVDTLNSCRELVNNRAIAGFLADVAAAVTEGQPFARAFAQGKFLPPLVTQMVATGDETGNLGKVMVRIADHYEREVERRLDRVTKIAEPMMLLIMGGLVGVIVSALILPIFKLTRAVG